MVSVPRSITGSAGSRVRLIFGRDGDEWLLLLNHDDGNRQWQVKDWKGIPADAAKQLNECIQAGRDVKFVDFGPDGAWYVNSGTVGRWGGTKAINTIKWRAEPEKLQTMFGTTSHGSGTHVFIQGDGGCEMSGGLDDDLEKRLKRINNSNRRETINFVRLFHRGRFFISDSEGVQWKLGNSNQREEELGKPGKIEEVAMAGDNSWVVVREDHYFASEGVDEELKQKLNKFFSDQLGWIDSRKREMRQFHWAQQRGRLARAQEAREAAREAAELAAREAAELAERERVQREAEEAERAKEIAELSDATRILSLETILAERLEAEAKSIREMGASLQSRKRSLRDAMQFLSPEILGRLDLGDENSFEDTSANGNDNICVVCQDESAVMAVVPCGHVCLCNECSDACFNSQFGLRLCPLCRGNMQSVLRVYVGR